MKERLCCGHPIKSKRVSPSVSAPLHLILQAPTPASHEWKRASGVKRLCQVCHLAVDGQGIRCQACGIRAHPQCGSQYSNKYQLDIYARSQNLKRVGHGSNIDNSFEPRIKKLLHVPVPQHCDGIEEQHSGHSRFSSSCGDSVAASTAIVVGTATASTETPRSESKTPEITFTPGCEVEGAEPGLLSSSASVPDSGCTGLLGEEDTLDEVHECHQHRPSESSAGSHLLRKSCYRDALSLPGHQVPGLVSTIQYVDGPIDGAPYALVNPIVKHKTPSSADSGISVDQMKDLDRLLSALVQEAESIPDIPYHAREDSLPFSYTAGRPVAPSDKSYQHTRRHVSTSSTPSYHQQPSSPSFSYSYQPPNSAPPKYSSLRENFGMQSPRYTSSYRSSPSEHYLQINVEDQPSPKPVINSLSRQTSAQPLLRESLSSNSFTMSNGLSGAAPRPRRSQSADGRQNERDENADEWLARQMKRLQEKRARKVPVKQDWLAELKRALPSERAREMQNNDFRPSAASASSRGVLGSVGASIPGPSRSNMSTPGPYSSDDEDIDREVEMVQRGRKVQRHFSETAYDRGAASAGSTRAPSQQSNVDTPGFPVCPPTPYINRPVSPGKPPRSPKALRRAHSNTATPTISISEYGTGPMAMSMERAQTPVNPRPVYMIESEVTFARDLSPYWYKPNATREETIEALRFQPSGIFIIRNSNSFPGAYGLAIKVNESTSAEDSVRHFLIEPTKYGVRLRGSAVEPVFGSLSALVYAHSVDPLALPIALRLPGGDSVLPTSLSQSTTANLLAQGAGCQLLFMGVVGVERVTGDEAVSKAVVAVTGISKPTVVSLRLSKQGLTLTDVFRQRFFRLHFPLTGISCAGVDPGGRSIVYGGTMRRLFGVVARPSNAAENSCVVLAELEDGQPAKAIVAFFQRVIEWQQ